MVFVPDVWMDHTAFEPPALSAPLTAELDRMLEGHGTDGPDRTLLRAAAQPGVYLHLHLDRDRRPAPGASKLGGRPDLPPRFQ